MNPILAHFIGDFLLQNAWMQKKTKSSWHCLVHVLVYSVPFTFTGLSHGVVLLILVQHFLQDRMGWAAAWQRFIRQTPGWETGRLIVDQVLHISFICLVMEIA
jgi:hypothetical protein